MLREQQSVEAPRNAGIRIEFPLIAIQMVPASAPDPDAAPQATTEKDVKQPAPEQKPVLEIK